MGLSNEMGDTMFIHIGNDHVVRAREIVAIIDYSIISSSSIIKETMEHWEEEKKIIGPASTAKSVIITSDHVYLSSLSISTLKKRSSMNSMLSKMDDLSSLDHSF